MPGVSASYTGIVLHLECATLNISIIFMVIYLNIPKMLVKLVDMFI
jgi:hypothetical protein